jgi:hypothetical protein
MARAGQDSDTIGVPAVARQLLSVPTSAGEHPALMPTGDVSPITLDHGRVRSATQDGSGGCQII